MSGNREVATKTEVLALGTQLVLRLNYSMEVARSSSSELAKIYGWRHMQVECLLIWHCSIVKAPKRVSLDVPVTKMYQINFDAFSSGSLKKGSFRSLS